MSTCARAAAAWLLLASACTRAPDDDRGAQQSAPAAAAVAAAAPAPAAAGTQPGSVEHCAHHQPPASGTPLPGESLYQLRAQLTDQHGAALGLASFRGAPLLVTMFYASCTSICPLLIGQLKRIEGALEPRQRARMRVLLISLDPARDTVPRLAELAARHGVDDHRWTFTRTAEPSVREVAALLGIRYRVMPDGEISHSPVISLLDAEGALVERSEGTLDDPGEIAREVARLLAPAQGS